MRSAQQKLTRVSTSGLSEADGRVAAEKFTRRLPAVETSRPCVVTRVKPRSARKYCQTESRGRAPIPIRHNDPPDAAPPATRYGTGSSKRGRQQESSRRASNPPFRANLAHKREGKRDILVGRRGRCRFDAFVGDGRAAWRRAQSRHEATRTTTKDMAPPSSPAAADDHPAASWGRG